MEGAVEKLNCSGADDRIQLKRNSLLYCLWTWISLQRLHLITYPASSKLRRQVLFLSMAPVILMVKQPARLGILFFIQALWIICCSPELSFRVFAQCAVGASSGLGTIFNGTTSEVFSPSRS